MRFLNTRLRRDESRIFRQLFLRYFLRVLLAVAAPLLIFLTLVFSVISNNASREVESMQQMQLATVGNNFESLLTTTAKRMAIQSGDYYVQAFFLFPEGESYPTDWYARVQKPLNDEILVSDYLDSIYFYSTHNHKVLSHLSAPVSLSEFHDTSWLHELDDLPQLSFFNARLLDEGEHSFRKTVSYYIPVRYFSTSIDGYIIVNFSLRGMDKALGYRVNIQDQDFSVIGPDGLVLYNRSHAKVLQPQEDFDLDRPTGIYSLGNTPHVYAIAESPSYDCRYLLSTPARALSGQNAQLLPALIPYTLVLFVFILFIALFMARKGYAPLETMLRMIAQNLGDSIESPVRSNEMELVQHNLLRAFEKERRLEEQLSKTVLNLNEAYSSALQAQINPHFLHNTLENIRISILLDNDGQENSASIMTEKLSDLFRLLMQSGDYLTTLEKEIEYTGLYIDIIQLRLRQQLQIRWNIPEALLQARVVKLSMQPLIENAVEHGLKQVSRIGMIGIDAQRDNDDLLLTVTNNGKGIDEAQRENLNHEMETATRMKNSHIGMINTNLRIKLLFGKGYGIHILSTPPELTTIAVRLPYIPGEDAP